MPIEIDKPTHLGTELEAKLFRIIASKCTDSIAPSDLLQHAYNEICMWPEQKKDHVNRINHLSSRLKETEKEFYNSVKALIKIHSDTKLSKNAKKRIEKHLLESGVNLTSYSNKANRIKELTTSIRQAIH